MNQARTESSAGGRRPRLVPSRVLAPGLLPLALPALGLLALGLSACAGAQRPGELDTRYRKGDFVVYRYSGLYTPAPVLLREQIVKRRGNELTIEVTATRGEETRQWIQVVTDSPENQQSNKVDALYEIVDGERVRLENEDNQDLARLYEWTLLENDGRAAGIEHTTAETRFLGHTFTCARVAGKNTWRGRPVVFEAFTCPGFLWTHGTATFTDARTGEVIYRIEVMEAGGPAD